MANVLDDQMTHLRAATWTIAAECAVLAKDGYTGVQVAPPQNSLKRTELGNGSDTILHPWWEVYQPVTYNLTSRMVNEAQFRSMVATCRGAVDDAREHLQRALAIVEDTGSKSAGQSVVEVAAGLAALREEWQRAAHYFGAAEAQAAQTGLHRDPTDEAFLAPLVAKARLAIGETSFAVAETAGRAQHYDATIAEIRVWLQNINPS